MWMSHLALQIEFVQKCFKPFWPRISAVNPSSRLPLLCTVPLDELILYVSGYLDEYIKLSLAVNISIQIFLRDVQVLKFLSYKCVVRHGIMVESLGPQIPGGYSEMLWTFALALKFLLNCKSLMHGWWFESFSKRVKLYIHLLNVLISLLFLFLSKSLLLL